MNKLGVVINREDKQRVRDKLNWWRRNKWMDLWVNNGLERINEFIQKLIINLRSYLSFRIPKTIIQHFPLEEYRNETNSATRQKQSITKNNGAPGAPAVVNFCFNYAKTKELRKDRSAPVLCNHHIFYKLSVPTNQS